MASLFKKIFGSSPKESKVKKETPTQKSEVKKETSSEILKFNNDPIIPIPESQESIEYWEGEIDRIIPENVINRGVIEAAFKGMPFHKGLLGLAFLPFSEEHAMTWLRKAAEQNHIFAKKSLDILTKRDSDSFILIWWGEKDFTNIFHSEIKIHTLNKAMDASLNKTVIRNVTLVPFFEEVVKSNRNSDYFEFIRDNIDNTIIPDSEVILRWFKKEDSSESNNNTVNTTTSNQDSEEFFSKDELDELFENYDNDDNVSEDGNDKALLDEIFKDIEDEDVSESKSSSDKASSVASLFKQRLREDKEKNNC